MPSAFVPFLARAGRLLGDLIPRRDAFVDMTDRELLDIGLRRVPSGRIKAIPESERWP